MRHPLALSALLLLLSALSLAAVPVSHAEEDEVAAGAPTAERVDALSARVAELRETLVDLEKRLKELEDAMDREEKGQAARRRPKPKSTPEPTEEPATEADAPEGEAGEAEDEGDTTEEMPGEEEPGGEEADGDAMVAAIAGTYELDVAALADAMESALRADFAAQGDDLPPDMVDSIVTGMRAQIEKATFRLVLAMDLTFDIEVSMAGEEHTAAGTWEWDGEVMTLHQTHEDGEEADEPTDLVGTWDDGELRLKPDAEDDIPVELVLRKVE